MNATAMAYAISTPSYLCHSSSSSPSRKHTLYTLSTCRNSNPNAPNFRFSTWIRQLGLTPFSSWDGLRHLGISISRQSVRLERKRKCKGKTVFASLFGVGAPEALVIGVVALLVFGPKGLAEVARNLGKTFREFQPTIRELQEVSREFKSTLEREIGIDEIKNPLKDYNSKTTNTTSSPSPIASSVDSQTMVDTNGSPSPNSAYSTEDYLKITEEQLKASADQKQKQTAASPRESLVEPLSQSQDSVQEAAAVMPPPQKPKSET